MHETLERINQNRVNFSIGLFLTDSHNFFTRILMSLYGILIAVRVVWLVGRFTFNITLELWRDRYLRLGAMYSADPQAQIWSGYSNNNFCQIGLIMEHSVLPSILKARRPCKPSVQILLWCGKRKRPNALMWPQTTHKPHPLVMPRLGRTLEHLLTIQH